MDGFADSSQHLLAELERIDLLIQDQVAQVRRLQTADEQFRGLYISEQELDALLKQPIGRPHWFQVHHENGDDLKDAHHLLKDQLAQRKQAARESGIELRLETLQRLFSVE